MLIVGSAKRATGPAQGLRARSIVRREEGQPGWFNELALARVTRERQKRKYVHECYRAASTKSSLRGGVRGGCGDGSNGWADSNRYWAGPETAVRANRERIL